MSILLESLRQSSDKHGNDIPGVEDSHFDDEMLSDEWLLAKLRLWKIVCATLVLALAITSMGWILSASQPVSDSSEPNVEIATKQANKSNEGITGKLENQSSSEPLEKQKEFGALEVKSSVERQPDTLPVRQKYVPKKVEQPVVANSSSDTKSSVINQPQTQARLKSNATVSQSKSTGFETATDSVVDYESLSQQQQSEMPELEISSYAVSSNNKKSFVVLNGAFYGHGETIAPNLVLISIEKESIVVRYFDQLIRKKYGL